MTACTNCGMPLAQGETDLCYPCSKASPQEKIRRKEATIAKPDKPVKGPHVNLLNSLPATVERKLLLGLSSGQQLTVNKLMLFPEQDIQQYLALKAKAQEELGGFSSGIGFWGSPEWAIGGAAALGLVESLISNAKTKKGLQTLNEAAQMQAKMRSMGVFFEIHSISGNWQHDPYAWRVVQPSEDADSAHTSFIHNGDEFIWVEIDELPTAIRWSSVLSYQLT
jgi:hypothetical protein